MITGYVPPVIATEAKKGLADFASMDVLATKPTRKAKEEPQEMELSETELKLIEGLRDGSTSFDVVQREVASRAFEKILRNPSSLKVKDWLQSELIKIKKEESNAKIGAMEIFLRKMFSGNLPTHCAKCGAPLFATALEGTIIHESESNPDLF